MARSYLHDYMPAIRNLSDKTIETYKQSLKTYLRFLKEKKNIEDELVSFEAFTRDYVRVYYLVERSRGINQNNKSQDHIYPFFFKILWTGGL